MTTFPTTPTVTVHDLDNHDLLAEAIALLTDVFGQDRPIMLRRVDGTQQMTVADLEVGVNGARVLGDAGVRGLHLVRIDEGMSPAELGARVLQAVSQSDHPSRSEFSEFDEPHKFYESGRTAASEDPATSPAAAAMEGDVPASASSVPGEVGAAVADGAVSPGLFPPDDTHVGGDEQARGVEPAALVSVEPAPGDAEPSAADDPGAGHEASSFDMGAELGADLDSDGWLVEEVMKFLELQPAQFDEILATVNSGGGMVGGAWLDAVLRRLVTEGEVESNGEVFRLVEGDDTPEPAAVAELDPRSGPATYEPPLNDPECEDGPYIAPALPASSSSSPPPSAAPEHPVDDVDEAPDPIVEEILADLAQHGASRVREIMGRVGLSQPTVNRRLKDLIAAGRAESAGDYRYRAVGADEPSNVRELHPEKAAEPLAPARAVDPVAEGIVAVLASCSSELGMTAHDVHAALRVEMAAGHSESETVRVLDVLIDAGRVRCRSGLYRLTGKAESA